MVGLKTKQYTIKKNRWILTEWNQRRKWYKTFREGFLWEGHNVQDVATRRMEQNQALVLDFYNQTKTQRSPNPIIRFWLN
jgi:hypothetical protein